MTVSSETARVQYAGDGTTTAFPVPYYFLANEDLAILRSVDNGPWTPVNPSEIASITGAGNPAGGTVTLRPHRSPRIGSQSSADNN